MIVTMSREVRDWETVGVGALSPIPAASCILAEQTHAPHAEIIILGSEEYYPFSGGTSQFHFLAQRGELDLFFVSGIQIDKEGNFNLHVIGDDKSPKVRMPGAYGTGMLYYMVRRTVLFRTEHTQRTLVERVDFVTGAGVTPDSVYRLGGPTKLVTPMAVLSFEREPLGWRVESIHPGYSLEDVRGNTGFVLKAPEPMSQTPLPTEEQLHKLRTVVKEKVARIYPDFVRENIGVRS
jgi:glutaconate CoA-transferase subunit B